MEDHSTNETFVAGDNELSWQREMTREYVSRNVHTFLLYFNVYDYVFTPSLATKTGYHPVRLRTYLGHLLRHKVHDPRLVVMYYSLSRGIEFLEPGMEADANRLEEQARKLLAGASQQGRDEHRLPLATEAGITLCRLDRMLTVPRKEGTDDKAGDPRLALIIEYVDHLAPSEDSPTFTPDGHLIAEMIQQWALDERIRANRHIIVLLTADLGRAARSLTASTGEICALKVDLPDHEERLTWIRWLVKKMEQEQHPNPLRSNVSAELLAAQTSGFSYDNIRDLMYYSLQTPVGLNLELLRKRKREVTAGESRDLLDIVEPSHGFEAIAGYRYVVEYLRRISRAMRVQDRALARIVPKAMLFLGPPGTGKSFLAQALAKEAGFNMVQMRNIRSMWVGESERNLNRVLDLLRAMAPVIVFVDEVDQALGRREEGFLGDSSGVERRILQRILEFMALDENRGRILWIAASNRPDLIDAALLSRFDVVVPFVLPDRETRQEMLEKVYPQKIGYQMATLSSEQWEELLTRTEGFSGREIDTICRRALTGAVERCLQELETAMPGACSAVSSPVVGYEMLRDAILKYRPNRDQLQYELQTLLALQATNFCDFLPPKELIPEEVLRKDKESAQGAELSPLDEDKLQRAIEERRIRLASMR